MAQEPERYEPTSILDTTKLMENLVGNDIVIETVEFDDSFSDDTIYPPRKMRYAIVKLQGEEVMYRTSGKALLRQLEEIKLRTDQRRLVSVTLKKVKAELGDYYSF